MPKTVKKSEIRKQIYDVSPNEAINEQVLRALEFMKRSQTALQFKSGKPPKQVPGNEYAVPEPLILKW